MIDIGALVRCIGKDNGKLIFFLSLSRDKNIHCYFSTIRHGDIFRMFLKTLKCFSRTEIRHRQLDVFILFSAGGKNQYCRQYQFSHSETPSEGVTINAIMTINNTNKDKSYLMFTDHVLSHPCHLA